MTTSRKWGGRPRPRRTPGPANGEPGARRGGALLAVLWLSAALAAIGLSVSTTVRAETDRVALAADGLRATYLATGAVERGIQWMLWGADYRRRDGGGIFWDGGQPRAVMSFPSGDAVVEWIPESAKLNINTASPEDMMRVVLAVSGDAALSQEIVSAILNWRNAGPTGDEFDQFYMAINPTFHARHASFQEIEELLLVRGMTPELYYGNYVPDSDGRLFATGGLRDCFSVWGSTGPFDVNTASPALMEGMGIPQPGVAAIVSHRPFNNMGEVQALGFPTPRLRTGGNFIWTVRATARLRRPDGSPSEVVRTASAVVKTLDRIRFANMPLHVLRWYDDAWSQSAIAPPGRLGP